jgi:hypothetical protein
MPRTVSTSIQAVEGTAAEAPQDLVLRCLETSCWERVGTYCESVDEYVVKWAVFDKAGSKYDCDKADDG